MSKKTSKPAKVKKVSRPKRIKATVIISLILSLLLVGVSFAQQKNLGAGVTPLNLSDLGSHAKEYIYAGGKLSATEKPMPQSCLITLDRQRDDFCHNGGSASIYVAVAATCTWQVWTTDWWILLKSQGTQTGPGYVCYETRGNFTNAAWTGTIHVDEQTFTVTVSNIGPLLNPASAVFSASGGSGMIEVNLCGDWSVPTTDFFIRVTRTEYGHGPGKLFYDVLRNSGGNRQGRITIAGNYFTVMQGALFTDITTDNLFCSFIDKVSACGIIPEYETEEQGTRFYNPSFPVTREQMAAIIIRVRGEFNPPQPTSQRFADVPPTNPYYAFIDRMAALGITSGCGGGNYCPSQPVTREQMAAFMIRAIGEFNPPPPVQQRFNDVPPTNPFYAFIDQMAVRKITSGCGHDLNGNLLYCPSDYVTREQMAKFLATAFNL